MATMIRQAHMKGFVKEERRKAALQLSVYTVYTVQVRI